MAPILEVDDLRTRFHIPEGIVYAVNGVSFHISDGETLAVVGESGCGKSVTMLSVLGLIPIPPGEIVSGSAHYLGQDLLKKSEAEMEHIRGKEIAMIFQDPMTSLNPVLTIGKQISESLTTHLGDSQEEANSRTVEILERVGIPDPRQRLGDYPHQFSGGMRQRVMIAMALACNPNLLIADEPTTALVAGRGLLLGGERVRSAWIDHLVRQIALGRGYFGGSALKRMGAAVVRRDTAALLALAPEVDVNHEGKGGMTLLRLAVDQGFESGGADSSIPSALPVVRTLIGLGARPEQGLEVATKLADPEYLRVLLEAGANPGHRTSEGPVIFAWLGVMPVTNLRVLADHGLDLNLTDRYGARLLVAAAEQDRWDLIELLLDRGADPGRRDRHGRAVGDVVLDRITSATSYGRPAPPGLERIRARLAGNGVTR